MHIYNSSLPSSLQSLIPHSPPKHPFVTCNVTILFVIFI